MKAVGGGGRRARPRRWRGARRVPGGDINDAWLVELEGGARVFVKTRADARPGEYATEAAGLRWLGDARRAARPRGARRRRRVPRARVDRRAAGSTPRARRRSAAGSRACTRPARRRSARRRRARRSPGSGSARSSSRPRPRTTGPRSTASTGSRRCCGWPPTAARSTPAGAAAVERVIGRLPELAGPPEPPARLHGDLWSGNVLAGRRRPPVPDRPRRLRRPPRGRPRDAAAVRRAAAAHARRLRRGAPARRRPRAARAALPAAAAARPRGRSSAAPTAPPRARPRARAAP